MFRISNTGFTIQMRNGNTIYCECNNMGQRTATVTLLDRDQRNIVPLYQLDVNGMDAQEDTVVYASNDEFVKIMRWIAKYRAPFTTKESEDGQGRVDQPAVTVSDLRPRPASDGDSLDR